MPNETTDARYDLGQPQGAIMWLQGAIGGAFILNGRRIVCLPVEDYSRAIQTLAGHMLKLVSIGNQNG